MPTIAIVGAGSGLGLALARTFGAQGFAVALLARNPDNLDQLVASLAADGIDAAGFPADVTDAPSLHRALGDAAERFGGIDVLEYSPAERAAGPLAPVDIREAAPANIQPQVEYYLYGAVEAAHAVLPPMLAAGAGTLLFTTGAASVHPVPMFGNVGIGAAALRNWALNLGTSVAAEGVYIAHVAIGVWIGEDGPEGVDRLPASEIAERYWALYQQRSVPELVITGS